MQSIAIEPEGSSETRNSKSRVSSLHQTDCTLTHTHKETWNENTCYKKLKKIRCQR